MNIEISGPMILAMGFVFCCVSFGFGIICGIFWLSRDKEFQRVPEGHVIVDKTKLDAALQERKIQNNREKFDQAIPEAGANVAYAEDNEN
jgi:hypothetical protein